jgi:hypothetical protein
MATQRLTFGEWLPDQPGISGSLTEAKNVISQAIGYGPLPKPVSIASGAGQSLYTLHTLKKQTVTLCCLLVVERVCLASLLLVFLLTFLVFRTIPRLLTELDLRSLVKALFSPTTQTSGNTLTLTHLQRLLMWTLKRLLQSTSQ